MKKNNIDEISFKESLGCFATGVSVITTLAKIEKKDEYHGITINSLTSLSLSPPLILFSIAKDSQKYKHFIKAKNFTVNILSEKQLALSRYFAYSHTDKFNNIDYIIGNNLCPILNGALAFIECTNYKRYNGGDHTIIIGKVTNLKKISEDKPLIYFRSQYKDLA